ncbi:ribosomal protein S5 domain 2-type protein [Lipomyces kononenkoae]|uniref:Ribosomal protein S5 domain 2-type protein n=1 Tax=Lipomyces kononenkoae TaxID=34357 RepID=A0ACC3T596_LIPKO
MVSAPFLVSAPGKVILFGEHAVVYGKPAIAAAVSLRTFLLTTRNAAEFSDVVTLEFPDVDLQYSWKIQSLPWNAVPKRSIDTVRPPSELNTALMEALERGLVAHLSPLQRSAAVAFLYLYLCLCSADMPGMTLSVRSTLPIGAGLGSSASVSVCLAAALCLLSGEVSPPEKKGEGDGDFNAANYASIELIDAWAFLGERCIHGNPSGIDNAVASHGGAVMYQRMSKGNPNVREAMRNFPPLKLILIDSRQPRRTAVQVANVATLLQNYPLVTEPILNGIGALTSQAYKLLLMPKGKCDDAWEEQLRELVRVNHGLLVALGVSHPKLEAIRMAADELEIGETKLTGAGGGGCAITLVRRDVEESRIFELKQRLDGHGFEVYETSLGGFGVGCLFPTNSNAAEWEEWEEKLFSLHHMLGLGDREDIQKTVGVGSIDGWEFW